MAHSGTVRRGAAGQKKALVESVRRWDTRPVPSPRTAITPASSEHRRHARVAASWPVTVQTGTRLLHLHAVNVSALGVKVSLDEPLRREPLEVGRAAQLRIEPPGAPAVEVEAIVWRTDDDGPAFFFIGPRTTA
jgi:PilZ domain